MKKIFFLLFTTFLIISCEKDDLEIKTIHNDSKMTVRKIGKDTEIGNHIKNYFKNFKSYELKFDSISKTEYKSFKEVEFYLIPTSDSNICIGHYEGIDKNFDLKIIKKKINKDKSQFTAYDLNEKILYSYIISETKGFTDFISYNNDIKTTFSKTDGDGVIGDYPKDYDCGKLSFQKCVLCAVDVCSQDWRCSLAALAFGWQFAAGVAIVCAI